MSTLKNTYVEEQYQFPSIASINSSIPIFIGYTKNDSYQDSSILGKAICIYSYLEFEKIFGGHHRFQFQCKVDPVLSVNQVSPAFYTSQSIQLFFANGGTRCFVISVQKFDAIAQISEHDFMNESLLNAISQVEEADIIVMPDLVSTSFAYAVYNNLLEFCASNRYKFAIVDVIPLQHKSMDESIAYFRESIHNHHGSYGAAYYPWLNSNLIQLHQLNPTCIINFETEYSNYVSEKHLDDLIASGFNNTGLSVTESEEQLRQLHESLLSQSKSYQKIMEMILIELNRIPPCGAIAGIYNFLHSQEGIWKAPANCYLSSVLSLTESIDDLKQQDMNISIDGKSINAIRKFEGRGFLVWGARTLDSNNNEWRYINIKRTSMMIEQSIQLFLGTTIFEPNHANTWSMIKLTIENFLFTLWRQGAMVGNKPEHAFQVQIGLGITMNDQDILDGNLIVEVMLAILRPSEFIVIRCNQKMQTGI